MITNSEIVSIAFYANYDPADIKSIYIDVTKDNILKPILGDDLFDDINAASPSAEAVILRDDYCKPLLAFAVKSMVIANTSPRTTNVGAAYSSANNSNPSAEAKDDSINVNDQMIAQMKQRLIVYLRANNQTYNFKEFRQDREFITNKIFVP